MRHQLPVKVHGSDQHQKGGGAMVEFHDGMGRKAREGTYTTSQRLEAHRDARGSMVLLVAARRLVTNLASRVALYVNRILQSLDSSH